MGSARRRQLGLATSGMRGPLPGRDGSYERALAMRSRVPPLDRARGQKGGVQNLCARDLNVPPAVISDLSVLYPHAIDVCLHKSCNPCLQR